MHVFSKLYIDEAVLSYEHIKIICSNTKASTIVVQNINEVYNDLSQSYDPISFGKEILFLTKNKGSFIKKCPGTKIYNCCGYMILHIGTFCFMDCSYCILQTYFHPPVMQYFVNYDDLISELSKLFLENRLLRIGTGEFTDSLIWETITDLSNFLVPKFAAQSNCVLELKTKTTATHKLKNINHNRKTILSWSLNTEKIIKSEERKTASLDARISAAKICESWGYPLSFHFDPMVIYEGCEADYCSVIEKLFSTVSPDNIVWISLGSFRFIPSLKPIVQKRFTNSKIIYGEFITGLDGKIRYFKPLRINLYKKMVSCIKEIAPNVLVYLCMEDDETWSKSFGFIPSDFGGLSNMLDKSANKHCGVHL
ncbi:MAG: DNA photolyase [Desulfobacterales bacterium]|nr:DNA photolyase [Desulfobacterales bacterium]MBF0397989.1 DNA photolyase [Desulfobacterales bacterium]